MKAFEVIQLPVKKQDAPPKRPHPRNQLPNACRIREVKMALETLKDVKEIGGYPAIDVNDIPEMDVVQFRNQLDKTPIVIDHDWNVIQFKLQSGPIKESGVNGCQVDTIIEAAKLILEGLNDKFPDPENEMAINKLECALAHLAERTRQRTERGVEGTSQL